MEGAVRSRSYPLKVALTDLAARRPERSPSHADRRPVASVNLAWIRRRGKTGHDVELPKEATDDLVGVCGGTEVIELRHHTGQRPLDVTNSTFGVVLAPLFEAALALDEFLAIEV